MAPPKKGAKKGKKAKDDDWSADEKLPVSLNAKLAALGVQSDSDNEPAVPAPKKKSAFAAFTAEDGLDDLSDEDSGLMGALQQASKAAPAASKKKEKRKKQAQDFDLDPNAELEAQTQAPLEVADVEAEFEDKPKKKEKGGKAAPAAAEADDAAGSGDEDASRPLSKKEREKLKKQRQKEKEKAAKPKKAAVETPTPASPAPVEDVPAPADAPPAADDEEGEDDAPGAAASKNKKKKKKAAAPAAKEEPKGKPAKVSKQVLAMREALAIKQAAEEAQRAAEEAERKRIEDEERREQEEKDKLEAARQAKKQKQKEKEAQAKKEGKWKTPAQRKEEARAEAARQALLASGVKVAGLEEGAAAADKPKKVVYTKKKGAPKRAGPKETVVLLDGATEGDAPDAEEPAAPIKAAEAKPVGDGKDDWDAESDKEDVKDSWDAESDEEPAKPAAAASTAAPTAKDPAPKASSAAKAPAKPAPPPATAKTNGTAKASDTKAATVDSKAPAATKPLAKAKAPVESSSEEDSSEEDSDSGSDDSDSDDDSDDGSSDDDQVVSHTRQMEARKKAEAAERKRQRIEAAMAARSKEDLRSPICCILGHVDTGKTKLLDKIRQTNVQEGEAGGITQQIGATFFPMETIKSKTVVLGEDNLAEYKLPGLLVIDTPGHESFTNLRSRGSSLCNIAILVVDIVHGLEPQTLESLRLLRDKKTPFIVALNKIDRCYGWKAIPNAGFKETIAQQSSSTRSEYEDRLKKTIVEFAEQGLNAAPYYENKDLGRTVSLVPTSAITGEGIPDMLMLVTKLTQERMSGSLMYLSETECTVLEVKVIEGLGTTIDVVLTNGFLREGDRIVVCGLNGAIVTQIRALLTPQPLKEMRVKGSYVHHKEVKASLGIKIVAPDLEKAIAGSRLLLVTEDDDEEELKKEIMSDLTSLLNSVDRSGKGVWVQASTLGSLEALLDFLKVSKIPVAGINIGPVHKKDIVRASVMLDRAPEFAVCLCFDVPIDKDAEKMAEELGIKIFKADIIYHLFDAFTAHNKAVLEAKQKDSAPSAVWPCRLKILACFAKRSPIVLGCDVLEGSVRIGTPLCVVKKDAETGKKEIVALGRVASMEINHKVQTKVTKSNVGAGVAIKIDHAVYEPSRMYGRHFDDQDEVVSLITRNSIDVLKTVFRDEVAKEDWQLIVKLKAMLEVM